MALLQSQMTRYHDDLRPRVTNPTYASTNIGSTLGMYAPFIYRTMQNRSQVDIKPLSRDAKPSSRELPAQTDSLITHRRSSSQLSNVGTNSLKSLNRFISDREVFQKQQKNYNIISVQPKEHQDTIRMFPKFHLEDQDVNYFRKMQLEKEFQSKLHQNRDTIRKGNHNTHNPEVPKPIRGKYLNNVDEVADLM